MTIGGLKRPMSNRQATVFRFIRAEVDAGRKFPGATAIAQHMRWKSVTSAHDVIRALMARGLVTVSTRKFEPRGWRYTWELTDAGRVAETETKTAEPDGQARIGADAAQVRE